MEVKMSKKEIKQSIIKKFIELRKINKILDEEIDYLENHVMNKNEGITLNVERIKSWIYQTKHIKLLLNRIKGRFNK